MFCFTGFLLNTASLLFRNKILIMYWQDYFNFFETAKMGYPVPLKSTKKKCKTKKFQSN